VKDPKTPGCCKLAAVSCPSDLCNVGQCDVAQDKCILTSSCTGTPCFPGICTSTGCANTPKCTSGLAGCTTVSCNEADGTCSSQISDGCISADPCFTSLCESVNGKETCVVTPFCPPSLDPVCSPTVCVVNNGQPVCQTQPPACLTSTGCRSAGCDPAKGGCFAVPQDGLCQQFAPCLIGTCELATGDCSYVALNCSEPKNWPPNNTGPTFCNPLECDTNQPQQPCQVRSNNCSSSNLTIRNNSCDIITCSNSRKRCLLDSGTCFPLIALIAALAGGAIAGIVIAALIGAFLLSGGVLAATQISAPTEQVITTSNPFYTGNSLSGVSPLN